MPFTCIFPFKHLIGLSFLVEGAFGSLGGGGGEIPLVRITTSKADFYRH